VVQADVIHLLWGVRPWEEGEAWLGMTICEPLGRPKTLGGGGQQKGGPVFVLGGLDCLEVPRLEGAGNFPHVCGVADSRHSGGLTIFAAENGQVGGPPGFGVMGRSGHWRVLSEESYSTVERF